MGWRKSSYSQANGCVEVWRKSSRCNGGTCVEAATCTHGVAVRDSKDPDGPRLSFTPGEWQAFLRSVKGA